MKKWNKRIRKENTKIFILLAVMAPLLALSGCGKEKAPQEEGSPGEELPATGIAYETAQDSEIDFSVLKGENPDIFGWLYVPGTDIDCPILQSVEADDFYTSHNAYGEEDTRGALYTELANLTDMCDFNTVIHGSRQEGGNFSGLHRFADPDYFADHDKAYIYLEGNLLTYEIFAAYERENTSLIRTYDLTYAAGCKQFLEEVYAKGMGKNIREGREGINANNFLITLSAEDGDKQFVVVAVLTGDAAGTIDRLVE